MVYVDLSDFDCQHFGLYLSSLFSSNSIPRFGPLLNILHLLLSDSGDLCERLKVAYRYLLYIVRKMYRIKASKLRILLSEAGPVIC